MSDTVELKHCPKCGAPIPAGAPQGLCPKCVLLGAATATDSGVPATATSEIPSIQRVAAAFPQLEIIELIGRGGMGFVFKARQPHLDRFVALKLLPDKLARDPLFAERFNREGRTLGRMSHPNIVSVYDFGKTEHFYFLLMEFVDGVNLRQAMQAGRFSPGEALAIVPKICEALQYAHSQGILHRDIKPENILLDSQGHVKIADFGIAKLVGDEKPDVSLTATGAAIGTPHYMAPEQLEKPSEVDHRADIYSLGVVFYEMLTGELPIGRFAPPSSKTPVGANVDDVVFRTLEKDRERRYQSAGEMKQQVEHLTADDVGQTAPALPPANDFILCPPQLPRMAKAIIVYALVLAPVFWLLGLFILEPLPEHALVAFAQGAVNLLISGGEFLVLTVVALGGWKLRGLRPAAARWLKTALWLHLTLIIAAIAGSIWVAVLKEQLLPNVPLPRLNLVDGLFLGVALAAVIFEISSLIWLRRYGALLKSLCVPVAKPPARGGASFAPFVPKWSQKAVWAAVLTALSLPLLLPLLIVMYLGAGGLGGFELLLALGAIPLPGLAGCILGWMALSDIRAHQGRLRGLPLAVFGALAWPLFLLVSVTVMVPWVMIYFSTSGTNGMPLMALLALMVPIGTITFAIWAVYAAARWGANKPASQRRGILKWVFIGLFLAGIGIVLITTPTRRTVSSSATPVLHVGKFDSVAPNSLVAQSPSFGPVREIVLPEPTRGVACLLDFETGKLLTPPDTLADHLEMGMADIGEEAAKSLRPSGADAVVNMPNAGSLRLFEGVALSVAHNPNPPLRWEQFTPAEIVAALGQVTFERSRRFQNSEAAFYATPALSPDALAFITREGSMGVMEIIGLNKNPPGIKIRYKLLRSASAPRGPQAKVELEEESFGPEVEVIVGHLFSGGEQLALERKEPVTLPADGKKWGRPALMQWLADEGVDLGVIYYDKDQYGWGLAMRPTTRVVRERWSTINAQVLKASLASNDMPLEKIDGVTDRMNLYRTYSMSLPMTFALRTAAGRLGALQITAVGVAIQGTTNYAPGLKVRYKLAKSASLP